jgi:hypothetical protein
MRFAFWQHILASSLCAALASSTASAQSSQPAGNTSSKDPKASLKAQTSPVRDAGSGLKAAARATAGAQIPVSGKQVARKPVTQAPAGTVPANIPDAVAKDARVDPSLSSPASAATGTVDPSATANLSDEFEYVPMPGGSGLRREIKGGYTHTTVKETSTPARPVTIINIQNEAPIQPEPREKPRVWVVPVSANVSPTTGNLLSDGFLQYDRGPERTGHRISNDIWNFKDKRVRISVDENRGIRFQVIAELQGKPRRLVLKTDNLVGPRPLPADKCVTVSRVWYTRGKHGREPDSWWDSPATLLPIYKPLLVPSEDNPVPGQTNQAFVVTIYIPKLVLSGVYKTTLHVMDLDDPTYYDNIQVEVCAQPDGKKMRSVIG